MFELSLAELGNIKVVSATKKEQNINEAPAIISIITRQQINERGYMTVGEALNGVAGLYPLHDRYQSNLGLRGINGGMRAWSRIIKVMIDGQPTSYRPSSENFLGSELIPINVIERIEVIRGPASALYGANAFLGVINIITINGEQSPGAEVSAQVTSAKNLDGYGSNVSIGGKKGKLDYIAAASYIRRDQSGLSPVNVPGSDIYGKGDISENDISRNNSFYAKVQYDSEKIGKFGLYVNRQSMDSYHEFSDWGALTHNNRMNIGNYFVRGSYARSFSDDLNWNVTLAYAEGKPSDNDILDTDNDLSTAISRDVGYKSIDAASDLHYEISGKSSITAGFDLTLDDQNLQTHYVVEADGQTSPRQGVEFGSKNFVNSGYYIQAISNITNSLGLTAGVRYDAHNIYENVINYRFAAVYQVSDKVYTKLMYGTSYKAPSSVQLYSNYIVTKGVVGNPDLKPEKAKTLEAALGVQVTKDLNINLNTFYNTISDKVELILPVGSISNIMPDNIAKNHSAGLELELSHKYNNITSYANYSYQKSVLEKQHPVRGNVKMATDLYPSNMFKFGTNYKIPEYHLNFNCEGRAIDKRRSSEINSFIYDPVDYRTARYNLDPYVVMDFTVSLNKLKLFRTEETTVLLKIYNIFDADYVYPGFKNFDIPGYERTLALNISQHF
ncbi:TonB-dependent receptor plug domain-containing protein [Candidatus Latescibacterota bacterium]